MSSEYTDVVSGQGSTFTWGTTSFIITSVQVSNGLGNEIDITSMSSEVVDDSENTSRKLVVQDTDACFSGRGGGEIAIEFFVPVGAKVKNPLDLVGSKRPLYFAMPDIPGHSSPGIEIEGTAVLSQLQFGASTGEYVKGSATFKLSGQ